MGRISMSVHLCRVQCLRSPSPCFKKYEVYSEEKKPSANSFDGVRAVVDHKQSKNALRIAMLKTRFAHTILKVLDPEEKVNFVKQLRKDKKKVEKIKFTACAATLPSSLPPVNGEQQTKLKTHQREREKAREAARRELQNMEATVEFVDNAQVMRDLAMLGVNCSPNLLTSKSNSVIRTSADWREKLGLSIKDEHMDVDVEELDNCNWDDVEEGEIIE